jgi:PGF-pre-PGF domain-containing protein/PGF-CTERM protein
VLNRANTGQFELPNRPGREQEMSGQYRRLLVVGLTTVLVFSVFSSGVAAAGLTAAGNASLSDPAPKSQVTFDGTGSAGNVATYEWDFGNDGTIEKKGSTASTTFDHSGPVSTRLVVSDGNGNTDTDFVTVGVGDTDPPTAALTTYSGKTSVPIGKSLSFDASGSSDDLPGGIKTYEWDFDGDSTYEKTTTSSFETNTFETTGKRTVSVRVTDYAGNTNTSSMAIDVTSTINALASVSTTDANVGESVSFDGSGSTDASSYSWDVDGDTNYEKTGSSASYSYGSKGVYPVSLVVDDGNGNTDTDRITLAVGDGSAPSSALSANKTTMTAGATVSLDASGSSDDLTGGIQTYEWDVDGDDIVDRTTASPTLTHTYRNAGVYPTTVRVTDAAGKTSEAKVTVTVNEPVPKVSLSTQSASVGGSVTYDASASTTAGGATFEWDFNTSDKTRKDATGETVSTSFGSKGVREGRLTLSSGGEYVSKRFAVAVGDSGSPTANVTGYPRTAGVNEEVTLYAGESTDDLKNGIKTYEWDVDDDSTYEKTTQFAFATHKYGSTGDKTATVRVTDYAGNTDTATTTVEVRPSPRVKHQSVTHTGNGTAPTKTLKASTLNGGGMFQFSLYPDGNKKKGQRAQDLSGAGVDETTELWVNFTITNYDPDMIMGGAKVDTWNTAPNQNGAGTNFTLKLHPVGMQRNNTFQSFSPQQWEKKYDQANVAITPGVYMGSFDVPDGSKFETNISGASLTSDAQAFMPPRYNPKTKQLTYSVAAPHWKKNKQNGNRVQNTGFYEAEIPSGLVSWMGIKNPDALAGTYTSSGKTQSLSNMKVTETQSGGMVINVTNIHYSKGTISLEPDTTDPTAATGSKKSITAGESVTFDPSGSSDNRQISTYEWDVDGDNSYEKTGSSPSHTYDSSGDYTVTLRVTDGNDNTDTATVTVSVSEPSSSGSSTTSSTFAPDVSSPTKTAEGTTATISTVSTVDPTVTIQTDGEKAGALSVSEVSAMFDDSSVSDNTMTVSATAGPPSSVPSATGDLVVGYLTVTFDGDLSDNVDSGSFTFSLDEGELAAMGAEQSSVTVVHYDGSEWEQVETTPLGDGTYEVTTPGFSTFAVTADGQQEVTATPTAAPEATVTATPDATATATAAPEATATATAEPTATTTPADTAESAATSTVSGDATDTPTPGANGPGFGVVAAVLALLAAALVGRRR